MRLKTIIIIGLILLIIPFGKLKAQYLDSEPTYMQRVFYGGNLSLSFGTITYIDVSPDIGYRIANRLSMGVGGTYIYYKDKRFNSNFNIWGLRQFTSFTLIKDFSNILPFGRDAGGLLLYGEVNAMRLEKSFYNSNETGKEWLISPLLGPAYQIRIGQHSYLLVMLLYNFNESSKSPMQNPVLRVSFQF